MDDKKNESKFIPSFLYKIWPYVTLLIGLGYVYFTSYQFIPSCLFAYSAWVFFMRYISSEKGARLISILTNTKMSH